MIYEVLLLKNMRKHQKKFYDKKDQGILPNYLLGYPECFFFFWGGGGFFFEID